MGLLSRFQRKTTKADAAGFDAGDEVQRARSRARQRLIGAVVLVGIGIVGFPLLFETHPRPIPVDIPIEIANKDKVAPLALPPARPAASTSPAAPAPAPRTAASGGAMITEAAGDAGRELPASAAAAPPPVPRVDATPAPRVEAPPKAEPPARKAEPKADAPKPAADDASRARAMLEGKASAKADAKAEARSAAEGRFVVQVGAFAEAAAARDARQRVERLGLKTYTQAVDTAAGHRIRVRVGPFGSRDEADRAAGKLRSAGLPAALLTL